MPRASRAAAARDRRSTRRVQPSRSVRLVDVSPTGVALEAEWPFEKGRVYDLILRLDDRRMPVAARAVRVKKAGELYRAGFVFERVFDSDREFLEQTLVREVAERMTAILR